MRLFGADQVFLAVLLTAWAGVIVGFGALTAYALGRLF